MSVGGTKQSDMTGNRSQGIRRCRIANRICLRTFRPRVLLAILGEVAWTWVVCLTLSSWLLIRSCWMRAALILMGWNVGRRHGRSGADFPEVPVKLFEGLEWRECTSVRMHGREGMHKNELMGLLGLSDAHRSES